MGALEILFIIIIADCHGLVSAWLLTAIVWCLSDCWLLWFHVSDCWLPWFHVYDCWLPWFLVYDCWLLFDVSDCLLTAMIWFLPDYWLPLFNVCLIADCHSLMYCRLPWCGVCLIADCHVLMSDGSDCWLPWFAVWLLTSLIVWCLSDCSLPRFDVWLLTSVIVWGLSDCWLPLFSICWLTLFDV